MKKFGNVSEIPELLKFWDFEENVIQPNEINAGSAIKCHWKCPECGYKWEISPNQRYNNKKKCWRGCRKCESKRRGLERRAYYLRTCGCLAETHPEIAAEWDYENNNGLTPYMISYKYSGRIKFRCMYGHHYEQMVSEKIREKLTCPQCVKKISFPEQAIAFYLEKQTSVVSNSKIEGYELDIFLPYLNCALEYDGVRYHSNLKKKNSDKRKDEFFFSKGIHLIRIKEVKKYKGDKFTIPIAPTNEQWEKVITDICNYFGLQTPNVDVKRDTNEIFARVSGQNRKLSIAKKTPELLKYWMADKNAPILPEYVHHGSHLPFWWLCPKCNKPFQRSPALQNQSKTKYCESCARGVGSKVAAIHRMEKKGSLFDARPELLKYWDYEANKGIDPYSVPIHGGEYIFTKCPNCGTKRKIRPHDWIRRKNPCGNCYSLSRKLK